MATVEQKRIADRLDVAASWFAGPREAVLRQLAKDVLALKVAEAPATPVSAPASAAAAPAAAPAPSPAPAASPSSGAP